MLSQVLRALREKKGLTQDQLAKRAEVTQAYLAMLETGVKKNPSLEVLKRLAKVLRVSVDDLLEKGGGTMAISLQEAHLPTFFKIMLAEAARGKLSYADVGWHIGQYHLDTFELDEEAVLNVDEADLDRPTETLRRLFRSEQHPEAGLVDYIPQARRRAFLDRLVMGAQGLTEEDR